MNRELKFRVWDKQCKCWVGKTSTTWFGGGIGNVSGPDIQPWKCMSLDGKIMSNDNMGGFVDDNQDIYVIQQFTGLKDKNGADIYEGDILWCPKSEMYPEMNMEVVWADNKSFCGWFVTRKVNNSVECCDKPFSSYFPCDHYDITWFLSSNFSKTLKVVGNIFENLELLNSF